ncbi:hypothetical protein PsYK624_169090 [Phanerochaete sordida]|uniref:Uncharacterized protein n=1 Tax=Phanerochaete sordida TaxID=48140 RepID=A0A9P3LNR9_9APHY|nr:hypothetical protein PsYK624_169090 [Phanerochaete sordida]
MSSCPCTCLLQPSHEVQAAAATTPLSCTRRHASRQALEQLRQIQSAGYASLRAPPPLQHTRHVVHHHAPHLPDQHQRLLPHRRDVRVAGRGRRHVGRRPRRARADAEQRQRRHAPASGSCSTTPPRRPSSRSACTRTSADATSSVTGLQPDDIAAGVLREFYVRGAVDRAYPREPQAESYSVASSGAAPAQVHRRVQCRVGSQPEGESHHRVDVGLPSFCQHNDMILGYSTVPRTRRVYTLLTRTPHSGSNSMGRLSERWLTWTLVRGCACGALDDDRENACKGSTESQILDSNDSQVALPPVGSE